MRSVLIIPIRFNKLFFDERGNKIEHLLFRSVRNAEIHVPFFVEINSPRKLTYRAIHQGNPCSQNAEVLLLTRGREAETSQVILVGIFGNLDKSREIEKVVGRIRLPFPAVRSRISRRIVYLAVEIIRLRGRTIFVRPVLPDF